MKKCKNKETKQPQWSSVVCVDWPEAGLSQVEMIWELREVEGCSQTHKKVQLQWARCLGVGERPDVPGQVSQERFKWESRLQRAVNGGRTLAISSQADTKNPKFLPGLFSTNHWEGQRMSQCCGNILGKGKEEGRGMRCADKSPISVNQSVWLTIKKRSGLKETSHFQMIIFSH